MKIGELSTTTGTPVETIRFYEKQGLLSKPGRSEGNYRLYEAVHVERLSFIRHCRSLDMTLDEIRALLAFQAAPQENCEGVNALLDAHIEHVAVRIRELRGLEKQLKQLREQCATATASADCGILAGLSKMAPEPRAVSKSEKHVHRTH